MPLFTGLQRISWCIEEVNQTSNMNCWVHMFKLYQHSWGTSLTSLTVIIREGWNLPIREKLLLSAGKKEGQGHFNFWSRCLQNRVDFHSLSLENSLLKLIQVWKRFYGHLTHYYLGTWPRLYFYSIIWWMIQDSSSTVHGLWVSGFADNGTIEIL